MLSALSKKSLDSLRGDHLSTPKIPGLDTDDAIPRGASPSHGTWIDETTSLAKPGEVAGGQYTSARVGLAASEGALLNQRRAYALAAGSPTTRCSGRALRAGHGCLSGGRAAERGR